MKTTLIENDAEFHAVWVALAQFVENTECSDAEDQDAGQLAAARAVLGRIEAVMQAVAKYPLPGYHSSACPMLAHEKGRKMKAKSIKDVKPYKVDGTTVATAAQARAWLMTYVQALDDGEPYGSVEALLDDVCTDAAAYLNGEKVMT